MVKPTVLLAGASGDLGSRIATALIARGADVRGLVRPDACPADLSRLRGLGLTPAAADPHDVDAVAAASSGAAVVVSALNGLREVVLDRQSALLDAAVRAGVPRFIPSDFSADFTRTTPGDNRNSAERALRGGTQAPASRRSRLAAGHGQGQAVSWRRATRQQRT